MSLARTCTRAGCDRRAVATLTFAYADQSAVLGPLAVLAEPGSYDLCAFHAERLTAPRGWEVIRPVPLSTDLDADPTDDLEALANAVREASRPVEQPAPAVEVARRGHLRVLRDAGDDPLS